VGTIQALDLAELPTIFLSLVAHVASSCLDTAKIDIAICNGINFGYGIALILTGLKLLQVCHTVTPRVIANLDTLYLPTLVNAKGNIPCSAGSWFYLTNKNSCCDDHMMMMRAVMKDL
jgi:hypothetical protein